MRSPGLDWKEEADGVTVAVRVKPRASRSRILGLREGLLEVSVAAPPVEGAANEELLRVLSAAAGVARSRVALVAGSAGRKKRVHFSGLEPRSLLRALGLPEPDSR